MTKTKKYVRILKAPNKASWYADKIGQVFEVEREGVNYLTRTRPNHLSAIRKEDAELIVTEKRPAKKGERVLVIHPPKRDTYILPYEKVDVVGTFSNSPIERDYSGVFVRVVLGERPEYLSDEQYEVIVNNEVKNGEADEVERYDTAVETARDAIEELRLAAYAKGFEDARRELTATAPVEKTAQERRDEIVERAWSDIMDLKVSGAQSDRKRGRGNYTYKDHFYVVEFVVNREKRKVSALIRHADSRGNVVSGVEPIHVGRAKAAPGDCFNVHIGKAIALHRALGLEVPDEYLNAPQPTEVRVGDVVECGSLKDVRHVKVVADGEYIGTGLDKAVISSITVKHRLLRIIDDSRTEVGECL